MNLSTNVPRRIERLLVTQPKSHRHHQEQDSDHTKRHAEHEGHQQIIPPISPISPLTTGLLLLSLTSLRSYAEAHLLPDSHIREGFLEDVADLENPTLGRAEKLRVLDRMWRSWGGPLEWAQLAAR